jgi:DNA-binding GntR family transcriptional regulator
LITRKTTLSDLFEARKCIESKTVASAAKMASEKDINDLRGSLSEMKKALQKEGTAAFLRKDIEFRNKIHTNLNIS